MARVWGTQSKGEPDGHTTPLSELLDPTRHLHRSQEWITSTGNPGVSVNIQFSSGAEGAGTASLTQISHKETRPLQDPHRSHTWGVSHTGPELCVSGSRDMDVTEPRGVIPEDKHHSSTRTK